MIKIDYNDPNLDLVVAQAFSDGWEQRGLNQDYRSFKDELPNNGDTILLLDEDAFPETVIWYISSMEEDKFIYWDNQLNDWIKYAYWQPIPILNKTKAYWTKSSTI